MTRIAVLGEPPRVDCWVLAGAVVVDAAGEIEVRRAWERLPDDIQVVVVTPTVAGQLGDRIGERLVVVLP
jgi:vacuolar-type H+-ATPase subunit F/Vma7